MAHPLTQKELEALAEKRCQSELEESFLSVFSDKYRNHNDSDDSSDDFPEKNSRRPIRISNIKPKRETDSESSNAYERLSEATVHAVETLGAVNL
ncbi:hypothetical protein FQA39_LY08492 [Lamprigera yunnana]|nr:hypothetical protein FQA39_LY08492 [Lamprigera yunnana]